MDILPAELMITSHHILFPVLQFKIPRGVNKCKMINKNPGSKPSSPVPPRKKRNAEVTADSLNTCYQKTTYFFSNEIFHYTLYH